MKAFEYILYEIQNGTALLTINRPDVYNAMNRSTKLELIEAITMANEDSKVRTLILTGQGKAFSSGQDLQDRAVMANGGEAVDLGHTLNTEWNPLVSALRNSKKVVIGAINGVCAGAGLSVALACDFLIARPKVKFISGFAQIGLCLDAGSSHVLVRTLGYQKALGFSLLGEPLFSEDLVQVGLINAIEENEMAKAWEWTAKLNLLPPLAVERIKNNLQFAMDRNIQETIERETDSQRMLGKSWDYQEGVKAFFEKRKPHFQGR